MEQILICDDDKEIAESLSIFLKDAGYKTIECHNSKEAIIAAEKNRIDLIIMDIMLPGEDGITTVEKIHEKSTTPVIFLSAKSEDDDIIKGLEHGGDDYMTKPFNARELIARVKAVLKRSSITLKKKEKPSYKVGNITIDVETRTVTVGTKKIKFTPIEYNILLYLIKNKGKVLSSNDIYKEVWKESAAYNIENTISVHITHIREKIEANPKKPKYIQVVWGIGYKMKSI